MQLVNIRLVCFKARVRAQEAMVDAECGPGAAMLLTFAIGEENVPSTLARRRALNIEELKHRSRSHGEPRASCSERNLGQDLLRARRRQTVRITDSIEVFNRENK